MPESVPPFPAKPALTGCVPQTSTAGKASADAGLDAIQFNPQHLFHALGANVEFFNRILTKFNASSRTDMEIIERAIAEGNTDTLFAAAHNLKGASSYLQVAEFDTLVAEF